MIQTYLIRNASLFSAESGRMQTQSILVEGGIIRAIGRDLSLPEGALLLEAEGMIISPGWVDCHAHFYYDAENVIGVDPQRYLIPFGVTYALDPGSAGAAGFEDFLSHVGRRTDLGFCSYLNLSEIGVPIFGYEFTDLSHLKSDAAEEMLRRYPEKLMGVKIRISQKVCSDPATVLREARALCDRTKTRLCVHATGCVLSTEEILRFLKTGDTFTHCFAKTQSGILDDQGYVRSCVHEARERGIFFDLGHGKGSFSFEVAKKAIEHGFLPDFISTDLHIAGVNGPVFDMPTVLSKMLALNLSLEEILLRITAEPVKKLGLRDKSLAIRVGEKADLTAFRIKKGDFLWQDSIGESLAGKERIESLFTCLGDRIFTPIRSRDENRPIGQPLPFCQNSNPSKVTKNQ
ncbi:MAG: amidohydrolase family protein [Clostridia bacterium]|nr:amidohydrolase family protein [Clostridia bacterium]